MLQQTGDILPPVKGVEFPVHVVNPVPISGLRRKVLSGWLSCISMAITKSTAKKILLEAGAERVSDDAVIEFSEMINKYAYRIAKKAVALSAHAKRKTVKKEDINLAK